MTTDRAAGRPAVPSPDELNRKAWAAAGQWGLDGSMSELETLMWRSERHPSCPRRSWR